MQATRHISTISKHDLPLFSLSYQRMFFTKIPAFYILSLVFAIFQSLDRHGSLFCQALVSCRPTPPCWTCEMNWLPNVWNPRLYTLCINGRAYSGLCRNKSVFSNRLKCCVLSWEEEWKGCVASVSSSDPPATMRPDMHTNYTGECGIQILPRIIPAHPSLPGSWPWQVNIEWMNDFGIYEHLCGGTLVNDQWVVTAGHCLYRLDKKYLRVILGAYNLSQPTSSEIIVGVTEYFIHPDYHHSTHPSNDIALIMMKDKMELTWGIQPACLPVLDQLESTDDSDCWITGWGETHGTGNPNVLNELKVSITDRQSCNISWQGIVLSSQICVGNGLTGACSGDSGGPLVCRREGKFVLVGVTSWGMGQCYSVGFPNVFTRVFSFLKWIQQSVTIL